MNIEFTRVRVTRVNSPDPKVSTVLTCPIITVLYNTKHPLTLSTIQRETKSATDLAKEKNKKNEFPFFHERRYPSSLLPFRFRIRYEILLLLFFVLPRSNLHLLFLFLPQLLRSRQCSASVHQFLWFLVVTDNFFIVLTSLFHLWLSLCQEDGWCDGVADRR